MRIVGVIPARLAATRLPNKPLVDIGGKTMIERVWDQAKKATRLSELIVATPDEAIKDAVEAFGGVAAMTSDQHRSGTDRLAEVARRLEADIFVNIQGDEPLIDPATIDLSVEPLLTDETASMSSLMCPCPLEELDNPACVKVVTDLQGRALYFSRARIPYRRYPDSGVEVMQHIGLYAYRREFLLKFAQLPPSPLEQMEALEQLRALEHGYRIAMVRVERAPLSVDTEEDLERVRMLLR